MANYPDCYPDNVYVNHISGFNHNVYVTTFARNNCVFHVMKLDDTIIYNYSHIKLGYFILCYTYYFSTYIILLHILFHLVCVSFFFYIYSYLLEFRKHKIIMANVLIFIGVNFVRHVSVPLNRLTR